MSQRFRWRTPRRPRPRRMGVDQRHDHEPHPSRTGAAHPSKLGHRHRMLIDPEPIELDPMNRTLLGIELLRSHRERARRHPAHLLDPYIANRTHPAITPALAADRPAAPVRKTPIESVTLVRPGSRMSSSKSTSWTTALGFPPPRKRPRLRRVRWLSLLSMAPLARGAFVTYRMSRCLVANGGG